MNEMAYVLQAWLQLLVWQQNDDPQYRKGFVTITFLSAALIGTGFITKALHRAQIRRWVQKIHPGGENREKTLTGAIISRQSHPSRTQDGHPDDVGSEHVEIIPKR